MPGRRVPAVVAALACTLLTACSSAPISDVPSAPSSATSTTSAPASTASADAEAAEVDAEARRLAASLMVVGVTDYESARAALSAGAGGIFVVSWSDPGLLTEPGRDIHALRAEFGGDFEVSIDFEGGRVQRHSDVPGGAPAASTPTTPRSSTSTPPGWTSSATAPSAPTPPRPPPVRRRSPRG